MPRAAIKVLVTCSLVLHTVANLLLCGWILSTTDNFIDDIKGKTSLISFSRRYRLQPLMTALVPRSYHILTVLFFSFTTPCLRSLWIQPNTLTRWSRWVTDSTILIYDFYRKYNKTGNTTIFMSSYSYPFNLILLYCCSLIITGLTTYCV